MQDVIAMQLFYGAMILLCAFALVLCNLPLTEAEIKLRNRNFRRYGIGKGNSKDNEVNHH